MGQQLHPQPRVVGGQDQDVLGLEGLEGGGHGGQRSQPGVGDQPGRGSRAGPAAAAAARRAGWPSGATRTTGSATRAAAASTSEASSTPPTGRVALSRPIRRLAPPASTAAAAI